MSAPRRSGRLEGRGGAPLVPALVGLVAGGCAGTADAGPDVVFSPSVQPPLVTHVDTWDPGAAEATKKVFTHLFSADGKVALTKGPGGEMSHHRGIFVGFNRTRRGETTLDFWHCPLEGDAAGPTIRHTRYLEPAELRGMAGHGDFVAEFADARIQVFGAEAQWLAPDGEVWVDERRIVRAAARRGVVTCDVEVTLTARGGAVVLDGDPHHAGLQIRLAHEVHDRQEETRFYRSEGARDLGNDVWADCSWAAAEVEVGGRPFLIEHVDHPSNPEGRYSTRGYGRFGSCANVTLAADESVTLRCRVVAIEDPIESGRQLALDAIARAYRTR